MLPVREEASRYVGLLHVGGQGPVSFSSVLNETLHDGLVYKLKVMNLPKLSVP